MARNATRTREKLIRAGEHRFARDGVAGARLRDVVRDAEQGNDAAVSYHFGSRDGLLTAIVDKHMAAMEDERSQAQEELADKTLMELVHLVVEPTAALLVTSDGRDFLRIIEQLAAHAGVRAGRPALLIQDTALAEQLTRLEDRIGRDVGQVRARQRVGALITFLTASLAERARAVEVQPEQPLDHRLFVEELVTMLAAAMGA